MTNRHKAFCLTELLLALAVLVVLLALSAATTRYFLADIVKMEQHFQTWNQTRDCLMTIQEDMRHTQQMMVYHGDARMDGNIVFLQQPDGVIAYTFANGSVVRSTGGQSSSWLLPHTIIEWDTWQDAGRMYALEVKTRIEQVVLGRSLKRFESARVFFLQTDKNHEITP